MNPYFCLFALIALAITPVEDGKNHPVPTDVFPFAGGTGAGVSVQPVGFLVVGEGTVKVLPAQTSGAMERMVELLPQLLENLNQNGEKQLSFDEDLQ
mgnify:CR=1 FL=1